MASRGFPITQQMRVERRKRAEDRQAEYDKLTLQQKIDRLPAEPAAKKQRAKLLHAQEVQLQKAATQAAVPPKPEASDSTNKSSKKSK